jgi:hypothetical protein
VPVGSRLMARDKDPVVTDRQNRTGADDRVRGRFWLEVALAGIAAILCVLTLVWHDWIEAFGIEPDGGDGSLEWIVVAVFAVAALVCAALARSEWRRGQSAQTRAG